MSKTVTFTDIPSVGSWVDSNGLWIWTIFRSHFFRTFVRTSLETSNRTIFTPVSHFEYFAKKRLLPTCDFTKQGIQRAILNRTEPSRPPVDADCCTLSEHRSFNLLNLKNY